MTQSEENTRRLLPWMTPGLRGEKRSLTSLFPLRHRQRRILIVGDGNFSYSLAVAKQHQSRGPRDSSTIQLIATSYDSYDEVVAKYPESRRICARLQQLGATVLHRVDATNIRESLVAAGFDQELPFDSVVFNHPHCGEENVRRHQSLLSHFFASALEVLEPLEEEEEESSSGILLTLAEGQSERWQAVKRARHAGLRLYRQIDDVDHNDQYGVVYERKRHQNGKSFHHVTLHGERRQQASTLFIFRRQTGETETALATIVATDGRSAGAAGTGTVITSHKRKAEELRLEFACTQCERSFKSAQGLRTHVHMVHELKADGPSEKVLLLCEFCERSFKKEDARRQHQLAKHGKDPIIKPDWFETRPTIGSTIDSSTAPLASGKEASSAVAPATAIARFDRKPCVICGFSFTSSADFDAHWQQLQPRATAKRICFSCRREFDEERALRQHQNFCPGIIPKEYPC